MSGPVGVRLLVEDDLGQYFDVRAQAFGVPVGERDDWIASLAAATDVPAFGAFAGDRLLGALRVIPGGQFVLGRSVPMGGLAAVVVRPEARGSGVARALVGEALDWMRQSGFAVSSLHPASTRVYRSLGWEIAGPAHELSVPTRPLAAIAADSERPVSRLAPDDDDAVGRCYARIAPGIPGAIDRSAAFWTLHRHADRVDGAFRYGVWEGDELSGYVAYTQLPLAGWGYELRVDDLVAADRPAAVALWRFLGGHSTQVRQVDLPYAVVPGLLLLLAEQDVRTRLENRWMHRIVDLPAAVAGRGYPDTTAGIVDVAVTDPWARGAAGCWRISVANGDGQAQPVGTAAVETDIGALSALFIGGLSVGELRGAGRVRGPDVEVERLGALLAAPPPLATDSF